MNVNSQWQKQIEAKLIFYKEINSYIFLHYTFNVVSVNH